MKLKTIASELIVKLEDVGVGAYIWHTATTGSVYIRFNDQRIGSIRIGDHKGRDKLKYKFNIRSDVKQNYKKWKKDGDFWRFYIHSSKWEELVPMILDRKEHVKDWTATKFEYHIPKWKKRNNNIG